MSHPYKIVPARFSQGTAAYRGGQSLSELSETLRNIDAMHETAQSVEEHDEIAASGPSLILGFVDGFLEDFRAIVGAQTSRRNQRA